MLYNLDRGLLAKSVENSKDLLQGEHERTALILEPAVEARNITNSPEQNQNIPTIHAHGPPLPTCTCTMGIYGRSGTALSPSLSSMGSDIVLAIEVLDLAAATK